MKQLSTLCTTRPAACWPRLTASLSWRTSRSPQCRTARLHHGYNQENMPDCSLQLPDKTAACSNPLQQKMPHTNAIGVPTVLVLNQLSKPYLRYYLSLPELLGKQQPPCPHSRGAQHGPQQHTAPRQLHALGSATEAPSQPLQQNHRLIHCSVRRTVIYLSVRSTPPFDCTGEFPGDLQRAWGVIYPVRRPKMPGAVWHPIPVPVGRLPVARERAAAINTCTAGIHIKDYFCYCKIP